MSDDPRSRRRRPLPAAPPGMVEALTRAPAPPAPPPVVLPVAAPVVTPVMPAALPVAPPEPPPGASDAELQAWAAGSDPMASVAVDERDPDIADALARGATREDIAAAMAAEEADMARMRTARAIAEDERADELRAAGEAEAADAEAFRAGREGRAFSVEPGAMSAAPVEEPGPMMSVPPADVAPAGGPVNLWDSLAAEDVASDPGAALEAALLRGSGLDSGAGLTSRVPVPGSVVLPSSAGSPRRPRGAGGGAATPVLGPEGDTTTRDPLVDALIARPAGAANPYDLRTEDPLSRDLRFNDEARRLAQRRQEIAAMAAADEQDRIAGELEARRQFEAQRREAVGAAQQSYRRAADRAASLNIDPDGFYHSRGVGGTLASAFAIGLGALGSEINGGPNVALEIINSEIDRDLMAQQQRLDSAFRRADAEGTLYDMVRAEYGDREAALEAARALALENAASQLAEMEASLGSADTRLQAEMMAAQLRDQAAAARATAEATEYEWRLRMMLLEGRARERMAAATRAENRAAAGPGPVVYDEPTEARLNAANRLIDSGTAPADAARAVNIDPTLLAGAPRFAEATTADSAGNVAALSSTLDEIERLIPSRESGGDAPGVGLTGYSPEWLLTDEGRQMREGLLNAVDLLGRLRSGAAISAGEEDRFRRILEGAGTDEALRRGIARIRAEIGARTSRTREGRTADDMDAEGLAGLGGRVVVD